MRSFRWNFKEKLFFETPKLRGMLFFVLKIYQIAVKFVSAVVNICLSEEGK